MTRFAQLTPERLEHARQLRAAGKNYRQIAQEIGLSGGTMARTWLDPAYAEKRRRDVRLRRLGGGAGHVRSTAKETKAAMELMKAIPPDTRDLTARLLGDPLPGRRAIDANPQYTHGRLSPAVDNAHKWPHEQQGRPYSDKTVTCRQQ